MTGPPLLIVLPGAEHLAEAFAAAGFERAETVFRKFPDGESYVRIINETAGRDVVLLCHLHDPDPQLMPVLLAAGAAREGGAASVGLVIPYLPYMRQDIAFHPGEAVSSVHFARILSTFADWLVTLDPHLHRWHSLDQLYTSLPARTVTAAPAIAGWVSRNVTKPLIIGPDSESEPWVTDVARLAGAEAIVVEKVRHGDRSVTMTLPDLSRWHGYQPVIVDDIISTGGTMAKLVESLVSAGLAAPVCCAIHALFSDGAEDLLKSAGAARIVSCDTVPHATNSIPIGALLVTAASDMIHAQRHLPRN
ncbi:MAG: ribose-phosphate diphosphokinase [Hyphomonas sp.]